MPWPFRALSHARWVSRTRLLTSSPRAGLVRSQQVGRASRLLVPARAWGHVSRFRELTHAWGQAGQGSVLRPRRRLGRPLHPRHRCRVGPAVSTVGVGYLWPRPACLARAKCSTGSIKKNRLAKRNRHRHDGVGRGVPGAAPCAAGQLNPHVGGLCPTPGWCNHDNWVVRATCDVGSRAAVQPDPPVGVFTPCRAGSIATSGSCLPPASTPPR